jgi:hypothetical protein
VLENRHGVVAIDADGTVYGGGVFDGVLSTDIENDRNWIVRPYALAAVDRPLRSVLVIGLSMGPWTEVIRNLPGVERVDVVEINPGYLELIAERPDLRGILDDPRVVIHVDDGRRWLLREEDARFDVIVQNTTWHWRAHVSQLLSREHFELCRSRLVPGGLFLVNTTFSEDVMRTGLSVFGDALRIKNALLLSDAPIAFDRDLWRRNLSAMRVAGRPVIAPGPDAALRLETVLSIADTLDRPPDKNGLESRDSLFRRLGAAPIVTDDNMLCEFRELRF